MATTMRSVLCTQAQMESGPFRVWSNALHHGWALHRKLWEHAYIAEALDQRGLLRPGSRGLGFGVGREPLVALFAGMGCRVVATDLEPDAARRDGWIDGRQHSAEAAALRVDRLCSADDFADRVEFRAVDMNAIPGDLRGFDFTWSSCSFEHLGSIEHGLRFLMEMMRTLRPGGVGVHTTEFNLVSDEETLSEGPTVLFRARDLRELARRARRSGHRISLDLRPGAGVADRHVDVPPYSHNPHLRLRLSRFETTSVGLIIERAGPVRGRVDRIGRAALRRLRRVVGPRTPAAG